MKTSLSYFLKGLFFPRGLNCPVCGARAFTLCPECAKALPKTGGQMRVTPHVQAVYAPFFHRDEIRRLIHDLKYNGKRYLADFFAQHMAKRMPPCDLIVPVPMHGEKLRQRGYSPTEELARALSHKTGTPMAKALVCTRCAPTQTNLTARERRENVRGVYAVAHPKAVRGKRIALVDDVMTTGATLSSCAGELIKGGAAEVWAVTAAFAEYRGDSPG